MTVSQFQIPELIPGRAPGITLRDYQEECVANVLDYIERNPSGRPAIQVPTGGGKTVIFASVAKQLGYPVLVLAHRDELLDQAAEKFRMVDPGVSVGKVKAETHQPYHEVVVASIQTLARDKRLAQMPTHYRLIIIDEAHHATADSYRKVLAHFHGTPVLGVSATLERGDGSGLDGVFDELVYERDMLWMIGQGYLTDIRSLQIQLKDFDFARVAMSRIRKDFADGALGSALHDAGAPHTALKAYLEHASERRAIAFTPTVDLAVEFADVFTAGGVPAAAVSGETPRTERQRIYRELREGKIRVVANAMVLTEGFDEPAVDCVMVARPTMSRSLFIQMVGRGLRLHPGKADCLVLDLVGNTDRVKLVTVPNLFGDSTGPMRDGETVGQAAARKQQQDQNDQTKLDVNRDIEAISVDLFTQRKFNWIHTSNAAGDQYLLAAGDGFVVLRHAADGEGDLYDVFHQRRGGAAEPVASALSLEYAQGAAEDYVRRTGDEILTAKEATWRRKPASPKQINALLRWKVRLTVDENGRGFLPDSSEPLTAGEASDLLTKTIAKRQTAKTERRAA